MLGHKLVCKAGDVALFDTSIWHTASPNTGGRDRENTIIAYRGASVGTVAGDVGEGNSAGGLAIPQVRKPRMYILWNAVLYSKMHHFYQDRLGTDMGKQRSKREVMRFLAGLPRAIRSGRTAQRRTEEPSRGYHPTTRTVYCPSLFNLKLNQVP